MLSLLSYQILAYIVALSLLAFVLNKFRPVFAKSLITLAVILQVFLYNAGASAQAYVPFRVTEFAIAGIVYAIAYSVGLSIVRKRNAKEPPSNAYVRTFVFVLLFSQIVAFTDPRFSFNLFCFLLSACWMAIYIEKQKLLTDKRSPLELTG
ncbi:MAG TPA: hypothetical protein VF648_03185 [Pyrinomonadaceae bacterium]|jgi:hypothetical protein